MKNNRIATHLSAAALAAIVWLGVAGCDAVRAPTPSLVRETQTFVVDGVPETWRLEWAKAPADYCPATDEGSISCPCDNMRYGEAGELWLIRARAGGVVERMNLGSLFDDNQWADKRPHGTSFLAHWPAEDNDYDRMRAPTAEFVESVKRRPPVKVMTPADYDHDGQATEFILPIGTMVCGHHWYAVVGVSKRDPHLHAFASAEKPHEPLLLDLPQWQALQKAQKQLTITDFECGDHGSEWQDQLILSAAAGVIHLRERETSCEVLAKQGAFGKR